MKYTVNKTSEFAITRSEEGFFVDGEKQPVDILSLPDGRFHILHKGRSYNAEVTERYGRTLTLKVNGKLCSVEVTNTFDELLKKMGMYNAATAEVSDLKAPMPGLVVSVEVEPGALVKKGDSLLVLEAMKMENVLKASAETTVSSVNVKEGDTVTKNQVLVSFK